MVDAATRGVRSSSGLTSRDAPLVVSGLIHGHASVVMVAGLSDVVARIAHWIRDDPDASGSWGLRADYSEPLIIPVRRAVGAVNEGARAAHVVRLLPGEAHGGTLAAVCGERLPLVGVDVLPLGNGMPCERCLLRVAVEWPSGNPIT